MSYILDALRKSDQQRRLGAVPTLSTVSAASAAPARSALPVYGSIGTILIAIGIAIGWLRPWHPDPPAVIAAVAPIPIAAPAQAAPTAAPSPRNEPPTAAPAAPVIASPPPRRKVSIATQGKTHNAPVAAVATPVPQGGKADEAPQQPPLAGSDLPLSNPQDFPRMTVAVHAYSARPQDRLVSINDRLLREGDALAPDLKLEQITPDGMIFTYRGNRYRRGVK